MEGFCCVFSVGKSAVPQLNFTELLQDGSVPAQPNPQAIPEIRRPLPAEGVYIEKYMNTENYAHFSQQDWNTLTQERAWMLIHARNKTLDL